jgi:nitrite reductase/ring-hydroxylating ferredoxin subunit
MILPRILSLLLLIGVTAGFLPVPRPFNGRTASAKALVKGFPQRFSLSVSSPGVVGEETKLDYNWKDRWYALTFASYVLNPSESAEAVPASVFGNPLVLWKSKDDGEIFCADDVCPHRSAALSEGRLRDGKLECYYHGWQYSGEKKGECVTIPQLAESASIPKRACLRMRECRVVEGIVWAWMGDGAASTDPPRQNDGLDVVTGEREGFILNDFQIDLPYDHSYLAENLIDPAHIPISHDKTSGGGNRENARPYEMIMDEGSVSSDGFTGRFRTQDASKPDRPWTELQFEAPGIIRQKMTNKKIAFGAALHCMPLSLGRSRLLFRVYFGGLPWYFKLLIQSKPTFLRNLNSCKVLEQDVGLITTQEDHFARDRTRTLGDDFLLLGSSDVYVGAYRKWLDRVGPGMPWFQGLVSRSANVDSHLSGNELVPAIDSAHHRSSGQPNVETRYHRHVLHCPLTRRALERVQFCKRLAIFGTIASATAAAGILPTAALQSSLGGKILRTLAVSLPAFAVSFLSLSRLEQAFFVSFKRKDQLRKEKG